MKRYVFFGNALMGVRARLIGCKPKRRERRAPDAFSASSTESFRLNAVALVPQKLDNPIASTGFCVVAKTLIANFFSTFQREGIQSAVVRAQAPLGAVGTSGLLICR
jgi:hypothetical protein